MPPLAKGSRGTSALQKALWAVVLALVTFAVAATTGAFASASKCDFFAAGAGSDANPGTQASPFRTAARLAGALAAGQTGCLAANEIFSGDLTFTTGGKAGAPVTITSADPARPATIRGRIVTKPGGDWISFSYLRLDGVNADGLPSPTIGSDHVTLSHNDITNGHTAICINVIDSSQWGTGHYTTIEANRIHGCGKLPAENHDHGIYDSGYSTTVTNNFIYDNADRGVQLRGARGSVVTNNVIDQNGEGVIFGDLATTNNEVAYNIVTNSVLRANVESYWGSTPVGTGNVFHDNCVYATNTDSYYNTGGGVDLKSGGYVARNVTIGDPAYTNRAARDYTLKPASRCAGFGVQSGVTPGIDASASAPTAPPPAAPHPPAAPAPPAPAPSAVAPVATSSPAITGTAQIGATLLASTGTWTGTEPLSRRLQWRRCDSLGLSCTDVAGATAASYVVTAADAGARLRVAVTATNAAGTASATSTPTATVPPAGAPPAAVPPAGVTRALANETSTSRAASAPAMLGLPSISGRARKGRELTVSNGSWSGSPSGFAYRWLRCNRDGGGCVPLPGAPSASYRVRTGDVGHRLRAQVTASNAGGSAISQSPATATVER